ncbi:hypothetical protein Tco_1104407 [Tanacetum coccineum]
MPQDQGGNLGNTKDQPNVEEASKHDWFKKLERPPTPDPDWNTRKSIDFRPPQTWISRIAQAEKPPLTFDELMSTLIDFSKYVMHNLKIDNLTQQHLVGPTFNMLKGTCKSRVELEYHFKECYKAVTDRPDWNNPKGQEYPFDLSKPLPLIQDRGRQVVPADYFFNNLEYLKGIEDMVPMLWSPMKVAYDRHAVWGTSHWVTRVKGYDWYGHGYLEKIKGVPYLDKYKKNRLMCLDKLFKFSDGTLTSVRTVLHDIASNLRMDYLPKIRWSNLDRQRSRIMIKEIDKLQLERRLMRSLEKFIGGSDYGIDLRLLKRII